jgi:Mg2+-importing ATPase
LPDLTAGEDAPQDYWARPSEELVAALGSSAAGLTSAQARARLSAHGPNLLEHAPAAGILLLFLRQFSNPLVFILVLAAMMAAAVGEPADSLIIVAVLVGSALLTLSQEHLATSAVERLRSRLHLVVRTVRDGTQTLVPAAEIVPGDVVLLEAGALIPADGVLLDAKDLFVSQAVLTGESFPAEKLPGAVPASEPLSGRTNVLFMGTSVRSGTGRMLVVRTGRRTEYGRVARSLALRPPETEFQRGIRRFGYLLTRVVMLLVAVVFAANVFLDRPPVDALLFAIALAVGISPELLPAIISVTLARGARRMAAEGVIVRRLESIESLGSVDVLCCDKTGTLTEGTVRLAGALDADGRPSAQVFSIARLNAGLQTGIRNPLDDAIVGASPPMDSAPGGGSAGTAESETAKLDEIPYDFVRRRVTVVVTDGADALILTKGAVREVLECCDVVRKGGIVTPLDEAGREVLLGRASAWNAEGSRVLGVATKRTVTAERFTREDEVALCFEGFLLFEDRPKSDVAAVLAELRALSVGVKIITGDSAEVAKHVARAVGLDAGAVLTGETLQNTRDEALWRLAERTSVFAEVDPHQKERIIVALRKSGHVVGYLGDGINDAPALHAADVGISVESAADVARESADLVLLEHDLEVLRRGILLGRTTFANTLKYIHITTSANFGNMVSMAVASLFLPFLPLLAPQILLNNFLSDIPAMAIAGDRVDASWLDRPRKWEIDPIRRFMVVFGLVSSAFDFVAFGMLLLVFSADAATFRTGWFVLSLLTELVILFVMRTRGPIWTSRPSAALTSLTCGTAAVALILPYTIAGRPFELEPVSGALMITLVGVALVYGVASELVKAWFYRAGASSAPAAPAPRSK